MSKNNKKLTKILGCKTIFASADLSSFEKLSDSEGKAILSNSNIKIALKDNESKPKI